MVSYFAGLCELCGEPNTLSTPEQRQQAGLDVEVAACVECLKRISPAAVDTVSIAEAGERPPESTVVAKGPLLRKLN